MERVFDSTSEAIRRHVEHEHSPNGRVHDFQFRRELSAGISAATLRKLGILGSLTKEYAGDIPLAIVHAFPDVARKLLIDLDHVDYSNPLQVEWSQREEEIGSQIRRRVYSLKGREVLVGYGGEPLDDGRARNNRRRTPKPYLSVEKTRHRIGLEDLMQQESEDGVRMINIPNPK